MPHSLKTVFLSFVALVLIVPPMFWFSPLHAEGTQTQAHITTLTSPVPRPTVTKSRMPGNAQSDGPYKVRGNVILGADGKRYLFHGIGRDCHCTKRLSFLSVGMQALVRAVRKTGATNLVLVAGMDWGFDLSQVARFSMICLILNSSDSHPFCLSCNQNALYEKD